MEKDEGGQENVPNAKFAELLEQQRKSLRLVFLSACQSAVSPRTQGFADLGSELLAREIPAVVAMEFGRAFYQGIAEGESLDRAMSVGRGSLAQAGLNRVDFATPVLYVSDPDCLKVDQTKLVAGRGDTPLDPSGVTLAKQFVGCSAELRELQTRLDPQDGK